MLAKMVGGASKEKEGKAMRFPSNFLRLFQADSAQLPSEERQLVRLLASEKNTSTWLSRAATS